jgi:hypothetical protein
MKTWGCRGERNRGCGGGAKAFKLEAKRADAEAEKRAKEATKLEGEIEELRDKAAKAREEEARARAKADAARADAQAAEAAKEAKRKLDLPRVPGFKITLWKDRRVYVALLRKSNGGANWNGGLGREDYLDIPTMTWHEVRDWAGAATRDNYSGAVSDAHSQVEAAVAAAK